MMEAANSADVARKLRLPEGRGSRARAARGPLPELTELLMAEHGTRRVLDVRRPKTQDGSTGARWVPGALMSLGVGAILLFGLD